MKLTPQQFRITIASVVILGTIGYLAVQGVANNKSYYVTIPEMNKMGDQAYQSNLRVEGFVKPATIQASGTHVRFVLTEFESHNPKAAANPPAVTVLYDGSEPPPDTFKGDSQALAIGTMGRDGVFHATQLQAKCASKYAPGTAQPAGMAPNPGGKHAATQLPSQKPAA